MARTKLDETQADRKNRMHAEGKTALAEYAARAVAIDKNTARLRALRLAKESADREAALLNPAPVKQKRRIVVRKLKRGFVAGVEQRQT